MRFRVGGAAVLAMLALTPAAQAAQRYASPGGSGSACTQAAPCSLQEAIEKAVSNDEVILSSGTYSVPTAIHASSEASNLYIHGEFSGAMPKLEASVATAPINFTTTGDRLSYLEIVNQHESAYGASCPAEGTIERVSAVVIGKDTFGALQDPSCTVRDSVLRSDGENSIAIDAFANTASPTALTRNVTAIASGSGSIGILADYEGIIPPTGGVLTLDLKNAIVSGEGEDLFARGFMGTAKIVVTNSNFDSIKASEESTITGSPNQTAPPLFVDAATGDYHEAPGSPTIDAGVADQLGATDLEGNPRTLGAAPDIGAYEFVPPPAAAIQIQSLSLKPKIFRTLNRGGAVISRSRERRPPVGTRVRYTLSAPASVLFGVERRLSGRRVGKRCVKETATNRGHRRCSRFKERRGNFSVEGAAGQNGFRFSGRLDGRALRPGSYRLVAKVGDSVRRTAFRIAR